MRMRSVSPHAGQANRRRPRPRRRPGVPPPRTPPASRRQARIASTGSPSRVTFATQRPTSELSARPKSSATVAATSRLVSSGGKAAADAPPMALAFVAGCGATGSALSAEAPRLRRRSAVRDPAATPGRWPQVRLRPEALAIEPEQQPFAISYGQIGRASSLSGAMSPIAATDTESRRLTASALNGCVEEPPSNCTRPSPSVPRRQPCGGTCHPDTGPVRVRSPFWSPSHPDQAIGQPGGR